MDHLQSLIKKAIPVLLILFAACNGDTKVFEEYHKFENLSWNRFDILEFEANIEDIELEYDIYINIRHIPEVPYKEMLINFTIYSPSGDMRTTDYTLDYFDPEGNKLSECMGDLCDLYIPIRKAIKFYDPGITKFEIENKYPKVEMPGIMEVGIIVKKARLE